MSTLRPFDTPIYITQPVLPTITSFSDRMKKIWDSKKLTNRGPMHAELEAELTKCLKVPALTLINNGTIALLIGCRALGLSGEVITTPFTFPATPHVLAWNDIQPVFCDIDDATMNINAELIEAKISEKTTGIMGVHVFGNPCEVEKIQSVADKHGLKVIYDAAHAFGVEKNGIGIGNYGDMSMFSFHATKMFHTAEGGALTFRDSSMKAFVELVRNFGIKNEDEVIATGINGKMSELHAALGLEVLRLFNNEINLRAALIGHYRKSLSGVPGISWYELKDGFITGNSQYFVVRIKKAEFGVSRDYVYDEFKKYNVFTRKYFYPLCSNFECYNKLPSSLPQELPVANRIADEVLTLPLYGELSHDQVERICEIFKSFSSARC